MARSGYFLLNGVVAALSWRTAIEGRWVELAKGILPTLAGFSIAAFALLFAVLDERAREALRRPEPALGDRSPLLIAASSIAHAVVVHIFSIIVSINYERKPFPHISCFPNGSVLANTIISLLGLFTMIYGIILAVANALSIFRILEIKSKSNLT